MFPRFLVLFKNMKHTYPWNPRSRKVGVEDFLCDKSFHLQNNTLN